MKIARKISLGGINSVRGGFKDIKGKVLLGVIYGLASNYKEKVSETMGVSYGFTGEFRAIDRNGEETVSPVAYLPEPAQGLLKSAIDAATGPVEFGFKFYAVEDETAIKGYAFETEPLMEAKKSTALESLAAKLGDAVVPVPAPAQGNLLAAPVGDATDKADPAPADAAAPATGKGKGK